MWALYGRDIVYTRQSESWGSCSCDKQATVNDNDHGCYCQAYREMSYNLEAPLQLSGLWSSWIHIFVTIVYTQIHISGSKPLLSCMYLPDMGRLFWGQGFGLGFLDFWEPGFGFVIFKGFGFVVYQSFDFAICLIAKTYTCRWNLICLDSDNLRNPDSDPDSNPRCSDLYLVLYK